MINQTAQLSKAPFFIVGVQRSGSTLLRLILNAHSLIAIPEEARFLCPVLKLEYTKRMMKGQELLNFLDYLAFVPHYKLWNYDSSLFFNRIKGQREIALRQIIDEMYLSYCRSEGKEIWGDKSLFFREIDVLHKLFPEARYIHIVRDGRAVLNSWKKYDCRRRNAPVIALDWKIKIGRIEKSFSRLPRGLHITVRYEDMLEQPEKEVRRICSFIGVEFESSMLEFYKTSQHYIGSHHSRLIFKPIDNRNALKWMKLLRASEIASCDLMAGRALRRYGYETGRIPIATYITTPFRLSAGLPTRVYEILKVKLLLRKAVQKGKRFDQDAFKALPVGAMPDDGSKNEKEESNSEWS